MFSFCELQKYKKSDCLGGVDVRFIEKIEILRKLFKCWGDGIYKICIFVKRNTAFNTMRILIEQEAKRSMVVKSAMALFHAKGIKDVTMDEIARSLKMSKRTLYELFEDKESLLLYCVKAEGLWQRERLQDCVKHATNVLEPVLYDFVFKMEGLSKGSPCFFADLNKYPKLIAYKSEISKEQRERTVKYLSNGVEQGLFREDVNFEIVYNIISTQFDLIVASEDFRKYTPAELFNNFVLNYFRGCATPKGVEVMDNFFLQHRTKNLRAMRG